MGHSRLLLLALAAVAGLGVACSRPAGAPPAAATPGPERAVAVESEPPPSTTGGAAAAGQVVAEVAGKPILAGDLEERAASRLAPLRQQEYDVRKEVLDDMIADRLLDAEAARRGLSRGDLIKREVDDKTTGTSPAQVETIYQQNKDRFPGQTREEAQRRIRDLLSARERGQRQAAYVAELRSAAQVKVLLDVPRVKVPIPPGTPARGPAQAPVTIVEFTDYQCPYCHRAQGVMDQLLSRYGDKVRLVHLDFPLEGHPGAFPAARAARCAAEQGKFWEYHHGLMTSPGNLDEADLKGRAAQLGLNVGTFWGCAGSPRYDATIHASLEEGEQLGVSGTPAYFINGRMVSGARPLEDFTSIIDAELAGT